MECEKKRIKTETPLREIPSDKIDVKSFRRQQLKNAIMALRRAGAVVSWVSEDSPILVIVDKIEFRNDPGNGSYELKIDGLDIKDHINTASAHIGCDGIPVVNIAFRPVATRVRKTSRGNVIMVKREK